jgi:hypothetical protein
MARGADRAIGSLLIGSNNGRLLSEYVRSGVSSVPAFAARQARKPSNNRVLPELVNALLSARGTLANTPSRLPPPDLLDRIAIKPNLTLPPKAAAAP